MSGIYIKGMEMPTRCAECWLMDGEDGWCTACRGRHLDPEYRYGIKDKPGWCPLILVPEHGRLIDTDAIRADIDEKRPGRSYEDVWTLTVIDAAPTIIPASKEGE